MFNKKKYTYVSVHYEDDDILKRTYYYLSNEELNIGDRVLVDRNGDNAIGKVFKIEKFSKRNVPFPLGKTKSVIRKIDKDFKLTNIDDHEDYYDEDIDELISIKESYNKLFLNNMFGRLSIKRLMNLMFVDKNYFIEGEKLFYVPRMNMFFYKILDEYKLADVEDNVFSKGVFKILEREAIEIKREVVYNVYCGNNYKKAMLFCKENNFFIYDDTDVLEFSKEKSELRIYKKQKEIERIKSLDDILNFLKDYVPANYTFPDPDYFVEDGKIVHYMGYMKYDIRTFDLYQYLLDNDYISIERANAYYNHIKQSNEKWETWDVNTINYEKLNYLIVKIYNVERVYEGLVNKYASSGKLLKIVERIIEEKEKMKN